jgi:hypothetical protein
VIGGWGRLHREEIYNLLFSPNIIRVIKLRRMRWVLCTNGKYEKCIQNFAGKHEGKRPLEMRIMQGVCMRCEQFCENIAYQWKDVRMETKWSLVGYIFMFVCLQFYKCLVRTPFIPVLNFSPHFAKQVGYN